MAKHHSSHHERHRHDRHDRGVEAEVIFGAYDPAHGAELWGVEGEDAETAGVLIDIAPGPASSNASQFTALDSAVLFRAEDPAHGPELWRTDGTARGTRLVADIAPGSAGSYPVGLVEFDGAVYFNADDGVHGRELWRSDGTTRGTELLADIQGGGPSSNPDRLTPAEDQLFFTANDGVHGRELWRTDGTAEGTYMVKEIVPGPTDPGAPYPLIPSYLTAVDDEVYFLAYGADARPALWRSDGTEEGTDRLQPVAVNPRIGQSFDAEAFDDALFFTDGQRLMRTEGAPETTELIAEFPVTWPDPARDLTAADDQLFFSARVPGQGRELWVTDGSPEGTRPLTNLTAGSADWWAGGLQGPQMTAIDEDVYFIAAELHGPWELWTSDGTVEGTRRVKDIVGNDAWSSPGDLTVLDDALWFSVTDAGGNRIAASLEGTDLTFFPNRNPAYPSYSPAFFAEV